MLKIFKEYIKNEHFLTGNQRVILAVSGGVDSVVMSELFAISGFHCAMAHCNFGLRGKESDEDEYFVRKLAKNHNFDLFVRQFNIEQVADERGISIQMAARHVRYNWFHALLDKHGFDKIATAHHINDSIETALFNFTKGVNLSGIMGVPVKNDRIIRPLSFATKADILQYAATKNLAYRQDSSNDKLAYTRNKIRHKVIPILKEINPGLEQTFGLSQKIRQASNRLLEGYVAELIQTYSNNNNQQVTIRLDQLLADQLEAELILYKIIRQYGFSFKHAIKIIELYKKKRVGRKFCNQDWILWIDRHEVLITENREKLIEREIREAEKVVEMLGTKLFVHKIDSSSLNQLSSSKDEAYLDFDKLKFPLKIRNWNEGERFMPLGMNHFKKISDFLVDIKVPRAQKQSVCVLLSADEVAWVIGYRIDERFKITPQTKNMLFIERKNE